LDYIHVVLVKKDVIVKNLIVLKNIVNVIIVGLNVHKDVNVINVKIVRIHIKVIRIKEKRKN
jgi:hypothetical protein